MKILNKSQMKELIKEYPNGGIVFTEWYPNVNTSDIIVTDGNFGVTNLLPQDGEMFDWDWNIEDSKEDDLFAVYDNNDIMAMIQILSKGLKIELKYEYA